MKNLKCFCTALLLAGVLFTISCVDNTESEGVKELRKGKASLLNAQAALANAQAASEALTAAAEAAYRNALAAVQTAEAALKQAEANKVSEEAREAKAAADIIVEQARITLLKAENDLKVQQLTNQSAWLTAQRGLVADINEANADYTGKYIIAIGNVTTTKNTIATNKVKLAKAEYDLSIFQYDSISSVKNLILDTQKEIRDNEIKVTNRQLQIEQYEAFEVRADYAEDIAAMTTEATALQGTIPALYQAKVEADTAAKRATRVLVQAKQDSVNYKNVTEGTDYTKHYSRFYIKAVTTATNWHGVYVVVTNNDGKWYKSDINEYGSYFNLNNIEDYGYLDIYYRYNTTGAKWEYAYLVNQNYSPKYSSKADYDIYAGKLQDSLDAQNARYAALNTQLIALYAELAGKETAYLTAKTASDAAKIASDEALVLYNSTAAEFSAAESDWIGIGSPTTEPVDPNEKVIYTRYQTIKATREAYYSDYSDKLKAYNGEGGVPDPKGGLLGATERAYNEYNECNGRIYLKQQIAINLYNDISDTQGELEATEEVLAIFAKGNKVELEKRLKDLTVAKDKAVTAAGDANDAYTDAFDTLEILFGRINVMNELQGIVNVYNDEGKQTNILDKDVKSMTAIAIENAIIALNKDINDFQATIDEDKKLLEGLNITKNTSLHTSIELARNTLENDIATLKSNIVKDEVQLKSYELEAQKLADALAALEELAEPAA